MDMEHIAQALSGDPDYRVLRRFIPKKRYTEGEVPAALVGRGVILDTETTGKDATMDRIIEIGLVMFTFNRETGEVIEVTGTYNALEDPGFPIPEAASVVNGITDEMVKGKKIVDAEVEAAVKDVDIVIAHNSSFDRAFCEPRFPIFKEVPWACSRAQINWEKEKIGGQKLDYIAMKLGFFYEAHRAEVDCLALLHILATTMPVSGVPGLKKILEAFQTREIRVWAKDAPFDKKDMLKARQYRWGAGENGKEKAWGIEVPESEFDNEIIWLRSNIYGSRPFKIIVDTVDAKSRFSSRRTGTELMGF